MRPANAMANRCKSKFSDNLKGEIYNRGKDQLVG
jgi:hypothetical protein